jgi:hypothetical protein
MTDQAQAQSGAAVNAAPTIDSMAAMFDESLSGKQPEGQAKPQEGEDVEVADEVAPDAPVKFKVPALEGDGFEELTAEEIKAQRLMQADYTKKTQQVAEQRKAIEAEFSKKAEAFSQRENALDMHLEQLAGAIQSFDSQVDWDALRQVDPSAFLEAREQQAKRLQAFQQAKGVREQFRQHQHAEMVAQGSQRLVEALPELLDPSVAKAFGERVTSAASHYGFQPDEIANVTDHRMFLVLKDAAAFRELQAKTAAVKETVAKAPQLAKPGAPKQGNPQALSAYKTIERAKQSGKSEDLASAFDAFYGGKRK